MPASSFSYRDGRPILDVYIAPPRSIKPRWKNGTASVLSLYPALIDTGADVSGISQRIAHREGLVASSKAHLQTPAGPSLVNVYQGDIGFVLQEADGAPAFVGLYDTGLHEAQTMPGSYDVLIGRDLLNHVLLTFDGRAGRFTIST